MDEFYIMLNSNHSKDIYKNSPYNFRVKLNNPLRLKHGWKVGLCQYKSETVNNVYICTNICTSTTVGEKQLNVLRHVMDNLNEITPYYLPINTDYIDVIHIYILNPSTEQLITQPQKTYEDMKFQESPYKPLPLDDTTYTFLPFVYKG